jgi:hypothetical protein
MSRLFLQLGHGPQRTDWLAVDAARIEPVSPQISLLTGKLTGNFNRSQAFGTISAPTTTLIQWLAAKFPAQPNREIF